MRSSKANNFLLIQLLQDFPVFKVIAYIEDDGELGALLVDLFMAGSSNISFKERSRLVDTNVVRDKPMNCSDVLSAESNSANQAKHKVKPGHLTDKSGHLVLH